MEIKTYYCDFCDQQLRGNPHGFPCRDCILLLRKSIAERRDFNEFRMFGQIWKVPKSGPMMMAVVMGEGKYVYRMMKRLVRKGPSYL